MASSVTLPSANGAITVQSGGGDNAFVAQIIANSILLASVGGAGFTGDTLNQASVTIDGSTGFTVPPPTVGSHQQNLLYLYGTGGGTVAIPAGYNFVIDLMTGDETVTGSNVQIVSEAPAATEYDLSGSSSVASSDPVINDTGTQNIAAGPGNNTISLFGAGTVAGGTGTNVINVTPTVGGTGIRVQTEGVSDIVNVTVAAGAVATVVGSAVGSVAGSGSHLTLNTSGAGTVDVLLPGGTLDDTLYGGAGTTLDVTMTGTDAQVLGGTGGTLSVNDSGTGDTIAAFSATAVTVNATGTDAKIFGGSGSMTATLTGGGAQGNNTLLGGSGSTAVTVDGAFNYVYGGSGSLAADETGGNDFVAAYGASTATVTIAASASNATVIGGSNPMSVTSSGKDGVIMGGSGSFWVNDLGTSDSIGSFAASPTNVTLGGSADLLFGSSGTTDVSVSGANDTIVASTGPLTVNASTAVALFGNTGPLTFVGGAGASSIVGASGGSSAVTVGSGGVTFWTGGNDTTSIMGGSGQTTLLGAANSSMFFSGSGAGLNFAAGDGNETLNASQSLTNNIYGGGLDSTGGTTIIGGLGNDTMIAGAGADSLVGGPGDDRFVFFDQATSINSSGAHDYIQDWTPADGLFLIGYSPSESAASLLANATVANNSLTITLSDNTEITFNNVTDKSEFNGKILYSPSGG
jgi:hypothetical protein